jgi:anti-anti-sigma regulatory factor
MNTHITLKVPTILRGAQNDVDETLASGQKSICLDFSLCNFITVEGLEWLETLLNKAKLAETEINLINVPPSIYKVFKVAHIDNTLMSLSSTASFAPSC